MTDLSQPDALRNRGDERAPHRSPATPAEDARTILINKVSWGAVLAGVAVALVTQLVLNLIGVGVGAATLDPLTSDNPTASSFSIGAGVWWVISGILASLVGGYAAGRLSGQPKASTASWHGLTVWALTTLMIMYLLTSALGGILGGALRTATGAASAVANTAGSAAQTAVQAAAPQLPRAADPFASIEEALRGPADANDPAALRDAAVASMRALVNGDAQQSSEARERAAQAIARAQNVPVEQARTQVLQYEQRFRDSAAQAKQRASEAADTAAKAVSRGSLLAALGLIFGAVAAWFGGRLGAVKPTLTMPTGVSPSSSTAGAQTSF